MSPHTWIEYGNITTSPRRSFMMNRIILYIGLQSINGLHNVDQIQSRLMPGSSLKYDDLKKACTMGKWHSLLSRYRESRKKYRDVLVNPFLYSIIISIESCTFYPMENAYVLGAFSLFRRGPWRVNKIYLLIWFTHIIRFYTVTGEIVCLSKVRWYNFGSYGSNRRLPYHNRAQTSIINR